MVAFFYPHRKWRHNCRAVGPSEESWLGNTSSKNTLPVSPAPALKPPPLAEPMMCRSPHRQIGVRSGTRFTAVPAPKHQGKGDNEPAYPCPLLLLRAAGNRAGGKNRTLTLLFRKAQGEGGKLLRERWTENSAELQPEGVGGKMWTGAGEKGGADSMGLTKLIS